MAFNINPWAEVGQTVTGDPQLDQMLLEQQMKSGQPVSPAAAIMAGVQRSPAVAAAPAPIQGQSMPSTPSQVMAMSPQSLTGMRKDRAEQGAYDIINNLRSGAVDPLAEHRKAISSQEEAIRKYGERPQEVNLAPLNAWVDSMTGSKLAASYKAPESLSERQDKMIALQNALSQRKADLAKEQTGLQTGIMNALVNIDKANKDSAPMMDMMRERLDENIHQRTLTALRNNKQLNDRIGQYGRLQNAISIIDHAPEITPQVIHEFQQAIRQGMTTAPGGVGERADTYFHWLGLDAAKWQQYLTGKPEDLSRDNEFVKNLRNTAQIEQKNIANIVQGHVNRLTGGNGSFYKRRPDKYQDLMEAANATTQMVNPATYDQGQPNQPAAQAPAPQSALQKQDGQVVKDKNGTSWKRVNGGWERVN